MFDVIIIGAGVVGCAVARELSRYNAKVLVVEKCEDVCCGTSKANSAIIHAGYDAPRDSLMAELNVRGNEMMEELSKELDFPFKRNGSLVVCLEEEDRPALKELYERGVYNGVKGLRLLSRKELLELEPKIQENAVGALYAPSGGIVCPFHMTIALAENAAQNGAEFRFNTMVKKITREEEAWRLETESGSFLSRCIVNAAGVYADTFHNMVSSQKIHITPRKGEYCLFDKTAGSHVTRTVFQVPGKYGKGVLVTPTVHGNLLVGPTATDIENREGTNTTQEGISQLLAKAQATVKELPLRQVITSFAGLRAHEEGHEFIIGEASGAKNFFDTAGIESPGLSSAPAIGVMAAGMIRDALDLKEKENFIAERKGLLNPASLSLEERRALIREKPEYGNIICRCEMISEGEIIEAVRRPLGARSLDGVKRRTRAGMGRCQSGFCCPKTMEILARELSADMLDITKSGGAARLLVSSVK